MKARLYSFRRIHLTDRQDRWYSAKPAWRSLPWERKKLKSWDSSSIIVTLQWSRQPILLKYRNIVSSHCHRATDPMLSEGHLDVRVSQSTSTNVFTTTIYRKPTFTGLMTNWNSFVPFSYKKASVVSMIQQALSVCSAHSLLDMELDEVRYNSHLNGYLWDFVDKRISIGLTKYLNRNNNEPNAPVAGCDKQRLFVEIPFIGEQTDLMKKKIQHLTGSIRSDLDVRFVAKPPSTIPTFFSTKDPVPKHLSTRF